MAADGEEIAVYTMNPAGHKGLGGLGGPLFYAALPSGSSASETLKHRLVSTLWQHLAVLEHPLWKHCQSSIRAALPINVVRGLLGRPHLFFGEYPGPSISFSEGGGKLWAALSGDESDIGIDVAGADEFQGDYPLHRVFHAEELQYALSLTGGDLDNASALLWSAKEAVVKALGSAFHLVDPLQITLYPCEYDAAEVNGGYAFQVSLSDKALKRLKRFRRFPISASCTMSIRSVLHRQMWLSIALVYPGLKGRE